MKMLIDIFKTIFYLLYAIALIIIVMPIIFAKCAAYDLARWYNNCSIMKKKVAYLVLSIIVFALYLLWVFSTKHLNPLVPPVAAFATLTACIIAFLALIAWILFYEEIAEWKQQKKY